MPYLYSAAGSAVRRTLLSAAFVIICLAIKCHALSGLEASDRASKDSLIRSASEITNSKPWPNIPSKHAMNNNQRKKAVLATEAASHSTGNSTDNTVGSTTSTTAQHQQIPGDSSLHSLQQPKMEAALTTFNQPGTEHARALQQATNIQSPTATIINTTTTTAPPQETRTAAQLQTLNHTQSPPPASTRGVPNPPLTPPVVVALVSIENPRVQAVHAPLVVISAQNNPVAPRISTAPVQLIEISFGGPTVENNPLRLFNITGVQRYCCLQITSVFIESRA